MDNDTALNVMLFWIGLADAMHSNKELTSEIAEYGIKALDALAGTTCEMATGDISRRRLHYSDAPMPERKMRKARTPFRCTWTIGDTFVYRFLNPEAEPLHLFGKYAVLRKVSEIESWDNRILPVVSISILDSLPNPINQVELSKLPILKLAANKKGMLPGQYEYRAVFMIQSKKQLDKIPLNWIGNFDISMPENEMIFSNIGYMSMLFPDTLTKDLGAFWIRHEYFSKQEVGQDFEMETSL